ncbi:XrtA/PEP-CTERM system amidotransferase [Sedimenticola hydrogenitrophicus]|uniref:XrtA/PEP-CTERM system amidotransferase n=1 Tax=Sedimenticola hydrogenitrophicus TaxID=2967975 RepID=UPI0023B17A67|nr:XrtA/PEP-CTERM system amidotransferase [Sedimenticola hydrogenitrophicus]
MCGIVGIFDLTGNREISRDLLTRMNETLHHRGPDAGGLHIEPGLGLGHRRLSIIDLSSGQQPLFNEDGSVVVTYNGEIYNFEELSQELKSRGHIFRTHCDTEVIVHAWEEWGRACVERFRGMFAFAIWDRNRETLFLARDRLGKKPLHYARVTSGELIFSSELKALYVHPLLKKDMDPTAIEDYFALGYVPDPKTIFKGVYKLPPGHTLTLTRGNLDFTPRKYWDLAFEVHEKIAEEEIAHQLIEQLTDAVRVRMVSDVPLGAFLSGGVDSSAVVSRMSSVSNEPINTCSIAFDSHRFNESEFAALVAEHCHTNHYVEKVDPDDFGLVDQLANIYDEPYADSSAIPTYRVCSLAKKRVTVALSGDGADEYFSGYRRHQWHMNEERIRNLIPYSLRKPIFGLLGSWYPKLDWAPRFLRAKTTLQALGRDSVAAYFHTVSLMSDEMRENLFSPELKKSLQGYNAVMVFRHHASQAPSRDPLSLIQYLDIKTYLVGDIHTKVDRASMANSLEVRAPFLDHKLVEWVTGLPPELKLKGQEGKFILKKALEPYLPNDILYRSKMGFAVPLAEWFRGPLKQRVRDDLLGKSMRDCGLFNMEYVEQLIRQHQSGLRDYSAAIWSLLMFESFQRQIVHSNTDEQNPVERKIPSSGVLNA